MYSRQWSGFFTNSKLSQKLQKYDSAISDLSRSIEISPRDIDALRARSYSYSKLNRYAEAVEDANRAIEIYPKFGMAFYNRAYANERLGRISDAVKDYKQFLTLTPENFDNSVYRKIATDYINSH